MQVRFNVWRQTPPSLPRMQAFTLEVDAGQTILDCLNQIKWEQDGSLAFRKNCRNTICGSCSMRINGRATLACKENIGGELARLQRIAGDQAVGSDVPESMPEMGVPEMTIAPLGNLPVMKDLIVDMQSFWDHLEAVEPYVSSAARQIADRESLQTPVERAQLNQVGNCILCGACYSECNALEINPDFVGPHALAKVHRLLMDPRDQSTEARLAQANTGTDGVWGCTRCSYCNAVCPMDVAPLDQISKIKGEILHRPDAGQSRAIRHRRALIDLVKGGGWVDERLFGLRVVGNNFRDLPGLLSLMPLGWRMIRTGKFPVSFERSGGTAQVRSLIEAVQTLDPAERVADPVTDTPEPVGG
jgi:succinate dehydrogenase / fumarate reductase, iron-sulfur subunit